MSTNRITAVVKPIGQLAFKTTIETSLEALQKIVEGNIEFVPVILPHGNPVVGPHIYCNEDGKLRGLAPNIRHPLGDDIIVGHVVLLSSDDQGDEASLTDAEAEAGIELLNNLAVRG